MGARYAGLDPDDPKNGRCQFGECGYPVPEIDDAFAPAVTLFMSCAGRWRSNDYNGARQYLDPEWLQIEARGRGIDLDEPTLDVIAVCESVIREQDAERVAQKA